MTDEELNEIASRLRRTANDSLDGESLQRALARVTEADDASWRGVMRRIADLIDRGECENVYDGSVQDSCDNGFLCSVCGCKVEDEEHYRVSGVWNFCPGCGRALSPSIELLRPDGPAAKAAAAFVANVKAGFNEAQALASVLCDVKREARALCKGLDPSWRRARARALRRSRRNVETLKREGRCR